MNSKEDTKDKDRALNFAISQIDRSYGKGSVMFLGADAVVSEEAEACDALLGLLENVSR